MHNQSIRISGKIIAQDISYKTYLEEYAEQHAEWVSIEIVSPESHRRDRVEKFSEYECTGVKEYWGLDPTRQESLFYQCNETGLFDHIFPDSEERYTSRVIADMRIPINVFWQDSLPTGKALVKWIEELRD